MQINLFSNNTRGFICGFSIAECVFFFDIIDALSICISRHECFYGNGGIFVNKPTLTHTDMGLPSKQSKVDEYLHISHCFEPRLT